MTLGMRLGCVSALLGLGLVGLHAASRPERLPARQVLAGFPALIGPWQGHELPIDPKVIGEVGVTDYTNRVYLAPGGQSLELYIGYYASQRTGDTIHSPKNCLPGAGWAPVRSNDLEIPVAGAAPITVNEYVVQKDAAQALVLYWYQARGRAIASEYQAKFWMVSGAMRQRRTDGALVRLWTPMAPELSGQQRAQDQAVAFAGRMDPLLAAYIPN